MSTISELNLFLAVPLRAPSPIIEKTACSRRVTDSLRPGMHGATSCTVKPTDMGNTVCGRNIRHTVAVEFVKGRQILK